MYVVVDIAMEVCIAARETVAFAARSVDEEVALYVAEALSFGVTSHDISSVLPVVNDVVGILVSAFHFVVACRVVAIKVAVQGDVVCLNESAC